MVMGQYVPTDSIVHRLDPRAKLLGLLCLVSGAFAAGDVPAVALCTLTFAALLRLSHLSLSAVLRSARPVFFLVAFTFAFSAASIWWADGGIQRVPPPDPHALCRAPPPDDGAPGDGGRA